MSSNKKIHNRLDKLFSAIRETEQKEADAANKKEQTAPDFASPAAPVRKSRGTGSLSPTSLGKPSNVTVAEAGPGSTSTYMSVPFPSGEDWKLIQLEKEAPQKWNEDDQALVRQITDQLGLALRNAHLFGETQKSAQQMSAVAEIATSISSILDLQMLLETAVRLTQQRFGLYHAHVFLPDKSGRILSVKACGWRESGLHEGAHGENEIDIITSDSSIAKVARERKPVVANNVHADPDWQANPMLPDVMSAMSIPILSGDRLLGVFNVQSDQVDFFSEADLSIMSTLATQIGSGMQNARLFEETRKRSSELSTLNNIVRAVSEQIELKQVLDAAYQEIRNLMPVDAFWVGLHNEKTGMVEFPLAIDQGNYSAKPASAIDYDNYTGKTILTGKTFQVFPVPLETDIPKEDRQAAGKDSQASGSLLYIPLKLGQKTIGCLSVQSLGFSAYSQEDVALLENISNQISAAIQNARLFQQTEQSEADLRSLFSAMSDVIMVIDKDTRYKRIAPTNPSLLFRPADDLLGRRMDEILPENTSRPFRNAIHQALETGETVRLQYPLVINEQTVWFDASLSRINENEVFWVARDVTESKKAEEALQRNEEILRRQNEYLATAAEVSRLVTSTLDLDILLNRTVDLIRSRFGYYFVSIYTIDESGFNAVLREGTGKVGREMKAIKHSLAVGSKSLIGNVTANGNTVIVNNTLLEPAQRQNPLLAETRAELGIPLKIGSRMIGALDIHAKEVDSFHAEDVAVLETLADQIAVAFDNANSYDLAQKAVAEMREVDRLKSQFLANMSHELRTPLNSIIGFSRVILKGIDGPISEPQQQDLSAIYNSGQHLLGLINDILDLSKIDAGKMELSVEELNIADIINSVLATTAGLVKDKPIEFKLELEPDLPTVRADSIRIRQVLLNLISNATKFTETGFITVSAKIQLGANDRQELLVSVNDTGSGIKLEDQAKLFLAFSQVDASPTRKTGGTGLGLSICRKLIDMHGGEIGVNSEIGQGSTFYFTLPIFQQPRPVQIDNNNRTILCVDDDPQIINLYKRYLQPQGFEVVSASNPVTARDMARRIKPYAITLDVMMPEMDGWAILEQLKSDPETRNIPVILCSIVEEEEKGFSLGAADYLVKPVMEDDLILALNRLNGGGDIKDVLIIDDSPEDLRLMEIILSEHGKFHPILAEGGEKGWEILTTQKPHAVILDLFMPGLNGFAILERLRNSSDLCNLPVMVVSGMDLDPEQKTQLENFGQHLLQKAALKEEDLFKTLEIALKRLESR